jgi:hypothetical protein
VQNCSRILQGKRTPVLERAQSPSQSSQSSQECTSSDEFNSANSTSALIADVNLSFRTRNPICILSYPAPLYLAPSHLKFIKNQDYSSTLNPAFISSRVHYPSLPNIFSTSQPTQQHVVSPVYIIEEWHCSLF